MTELALPLIAAQNRIVTQFAINLLGIQMI